LSDDRAKALGVATPPKNADGTLQGGAAGDGTGMCLWFYQDSKNGKGLGQDYVAILFAAKHDAVKLAYEQRSTFAYFEPTTVAGYPAIYGSSKDERPKGTCSLTVGFSDRVVGYVTSTQVSEAAKPKTCERAAAVAEGIVQTMKAGR